MQMTTVLWTDSPYESNLRPNTELWSLLEHVVWLAPIFTVNKTLHCTESAREDVSFLTTFSFRRFHCYIHWWPWKYTQNTHWRCSFKVPAVVYRGKWQGDTLQWKNDHKSQWCGVFLEHRNLYCTRTISQADQSWLWGIRLEKYALNLNYVCLNPTKIVCSLNLTKYCCCLDLTKYVRYLNLKLNIKRKLKTSTSSATTRSEQSNNMLQMGHIWAEGRLWSLPNST